MQNIPQNVDDKKHPLNTLSARPWVIKGYILSILIYIYIEHKQNISAAAKTIQNVFFDYESDTWNDHDKRYIEQILIDPQQSVLI